MPGVRLVENDPTRAIQYDKISALQGYDLQAFPVQLVINRKEVAMHDVFISLFIIATITLIAPIIAHFVPRNLLPETVALVALGAVVGPQMLGWAHISEPLNLLKELGMGFLFLLAGYEVNSDELHSSRGRSAVLNWIVSFAVALFFVWALGWAVPLSTEGITYALVMTATALGTLLPILKERNLISGSIGKAVFIHGTIGEMFPIIMMALFLSSRSFGISTIIVLFFILIATVIAAIPVHVQRAGTKVIDAIHMGSHTTVQTTVRLVFAALSCLMALAVVLELDVVLGAFVAGLIMREALPEGRKELEIKLDGIAYGIFIPLFFIITGMSLNLRGVTAHPWLIIGFLGLLIVVRGLPIFFSHTLRTLLQGGLKGAFARMGESAQIALYSSTSLPIIVAATNVAVKNNIFDPEIASALILSGVLSVMVMPALCVLIPLLYTTVESDTVHTCDDGKDWMPWIAHTWDH